MASRAAVLLLFTSTGEASWGTSGVATRKLHGLTEFSATVTEKVEAVPSVGWYGPGPVADEVQRAGEFQIDGVCVYEEMPKILNALFTPTSASTSAAAPYGYHYCAPVTSTQANYTWTMEFGTSSAAYASHGSVLNGLNITGEAGSYWKFSIPGIAKKITGLSSGFTTAAQDDSRTMTPIAMQDTNLRISPFATGAYGTSSGQVDATLISFDLKVDMKRHLKFFAGSAAAGGWGDNRLEGTLKIVAEFNATAKGYVDELVGLSSGSTGAAFQRQFQIYASHATTTYSANLLFGGIQSEPIKLWDDRDGNLTVEFNLLAKFSTAMTPYGSSGVGSWLGIDLINQSSVSS